MERERERGGGRGAERKVGGRGDWGGGGGGGEETKNLPRCRYPVVTLLIFLFPPNEKLSFFLFSNRRSSEIQGTALSKCLRAWGCSAE